MKKTSEIGLVVVLSFFLTVLACGKTDSTRSLDGKQPSDSPSKLPDSPKGNPGNSGLKCLLRAYPEFLTSVDENAIYWKDGTKMIYDDGVVKPNFDALLDNANLKDQMSICYPKGATYPNPIPVNDDPGRIRFEPFFYKMYGNSPEEVRRHLVSITWLPKSINQKIMVTSVNGVDKKLKAVSDELDQLPPEYIRYLRNPGGTFVWRKIAGTNRQSTHSFGMTLDINVQLSNYWRNDRPDKNGIYTYKNQIPLKIVEIFEKHGFIWGGKWYHYDTMHFEYRPELLLEGCTCGK